MPRGRSLYQSQWTEVDTARGNQLLSMQKQSTIATEGLATCLRATLKQTVVYYAGDSSITNSKVRAKVIQRMEDHGVSIWNNKLFSIPATFPTINSCRVIDLSYALTVTLVIPRAIDLHVTIATHYD